ncbi:MAG: lytic transglycosylase domain-containing protein [Pseudomonadota bacterium]
MHRWIIKGLFVAALTVEALSPQAASAGTIVFKPPPVSRALDRHPRAVIYRSGNWRQHERAVRAVRLALAGKHEEAQDIKSELDDPAARTLIDWLWIVGPKSTGFVPFIQRFLKDNPDWPRSNLIRTRLERYMYAQNTAAEEVRWHFAKYPPLTPAGQFLHARALRESEPERAEALARESYRIHKRGPAFSDKIVSTFPEWITEKEKFARLSDLIIAHETTKARKEAAQMGDPFPAVAKTAHKLLTQAKDAIAAKEALPLRYRYQPALQYALMRYHLRQARKKIVIVRGKGKKKRRRTVTRYQPTKVKLAANAMLRASLGHKHLPRAETWWRERREMIHRALSSKKPSIDHNTAYELAANHGLADGKFLPDAEWMAGWIALRNLKNIENAIKHFRRSAETAIRDGDKSRGHYWLARALEAAGDHAQAATSDQRASNYGFTFYGLLGASKAGGFVSGTVAPPSASSSMRTIVRTHASGRLRALQLLVDAEADRQVRQFALSLARSASTANELAAMMETIKTIGGLPLAMKTARWGAWAGLQVGAPSFPSDPLPDYEHISRGAPERALVLGIARQESEFDPVAVSHAGARGFMQIMPATGKWLCRIYSLKCATSHLTSKPKLNVQLGSAFLYQLVNEWKGSYIMAAAGYNAGGSRVKTWNKTVGDPRKGEISALDWIELIPFTETRNYVKQVMRNVQIYRRLLEPHVELSMEDDLNRGRLVPLKTAGTDSCDEKIKGSRAGAKCVRPD